jgi:hypothetical protein
MGKSPVPVFLPASVQGQGDKEFESNSTLDWLPNLGSIVLLQLLSLPFPISYLNPVLCHCHSWGTGWEGELGGCCSLEGLQEGG